MRSFRDRYLASSRDKPLRIIDLGSQDVNGSYRPLFDRPGWDYVGVDLSPGENVDIVLRDPYRWREIGSRTADVVISGQAFEHIEFFWLTMLEVERVLKPHGICCIIAPAGGFEHRYPVDCWRFYPDGFRALARFARLEVLDASTQWERLGYSDDSDLWQDSVLVARRPRQSPWSTLQNLLRRALIRL